MAKSLLPFVNHPSINSNSGSANKRLMLFIAFEQLRRQRYGGQSLMIISSCVPQRFRRLH